MGGLEPGNVFKDLEGKVYDSVWAMFEQNKFSDGGIVGGFGGSSVSTPSFTNRSLPSRSPIRLPDAPQGGHTVIIQSLVINPQTAVSELDIKSKIVPALKGAIKRASQDGEFIMSKKGLRE